MKYRCPNCKELRDEDICPVCGILTEKLAEEELNDEPPGADGILGDDGIQQLPPPPPPPPPPDGGADANASSFVPPPPPPPPPQASEAASSDVGQAAPADLPGDAVGQAEPALQEGQEPPEAAAPTPATAAWEVGIGSPPDNGGAAEPIPAFAADPALGPAGPRRPASSPLIPQAGQQQLAQYVDDGYEVYLIAGIAAAGKTQLLDAYRKDAFLSSFVKRKGLALPTSPNQLDCHPVRVGRRKVVFVDTSGEHFKRLYPHLAPTGEITEEEIDFLRLISRRLSGLVLLLDLHRLWNPSLRTNPEDEAQVDILAWALILLRWLQQGGRRGDSRLRFQDDVNRDVMRYRRRLKAPVLVLFSRADELVDVDIPAAGASSAWMRSSTNSGRGLFPVGENPLLLAHHRLPHLLHVLETHADHFRFDFVHSLVTDRDTGEIVDPNACGVALSLAWLLDAGWRWPAIPTRYWMAWQRFVDGKVKQSERWQRLPDPEDVP